MAFFKNLSGLILQDKINDLYDKTNEYLIDEDLTIYNPGYFPYDDRFINSPYRNFISLYTLLIDGIDTDNKTLLDLSCGRGGGLDIYDKYYKFGQLYGIDINTNNIDFCNKRYPNITFDVMDSNNLIFDNKFDIITEIDSIFHVTNTKDFFLKVKNLLKDQGIFSFADMKLEDEKSLYNTFSDITKVDITSNIIASCENIINNINQFSNKEKDYLLYTSKNNLDVYTIDNCKFIHYTCYR